MNNPTLTPEYAASLRGFRESGQTALYLSHVKALRAAGWPLSVLAEVFQVSKTTISAWQSRTDHHTEPVEVPEYPKTRKLSEFEAQNLRILAQKASKVRRFTATNSPARQAAAVLEDTLLHLVAEGVSITDLAKACGVTRRAINQRLEKY